MKSLNDFLLESSGNQCVFYADHFDKEELGNMFIEFGEAIKKEEGIHEVSVEEYLDDVKNNKSAISITAKDKSHNDKFNKTLGGKF